MVYSIYKIDSFEKLMQEAKAINSRYKSDMKKCMFVIQTFRDNSYDFKNSCFSQIKVSVNDIDEEIDNIAKKILSNV